MYNFREQLEIVKQIRIAEGEHKTLNCPFCNGHKKFTIDRLATGELLWNCFRASCNAKGRYNGERSIEGAKAYLSGRSEPKSKISRLPIPAITARVEHNKAACEYLSNVNSLEAYESGLIKIRYAPREKRVLFYNSDATGAVGRALYQLGAQGPKWMTYGDVSTGIHVGTGSKAVLVEDAASACSIARLKDYTGVALLGTTITSNIKSALLIYKLIYICLDNDASGKAAQMTKKLRGDVFLRVTNKDPKELGELQLRRILTNELASDQIDQGEKHGSEENERDNSFRF